MSHDVHVNWPIESEERMVMVSGDEFQPGDYTILVVDDETDTRNLAKKILEFEGFNVELAGDGEQAINIVENKKVDLVLLDVRLPKINGFDVCAKIKERKTDKIPIVIFFTVLSFNVDREKAEKVGGDGFLVKPFSADDLVDYIKKKLMAL